MHLKSRKRNHRRSKARPSRISRFTLEELTPRVLLSFIAGWTEPDDLSDFIKPGYGIPDATYIDPFASLLPHADFVLSEGLSDNLAYQTQSETDYLPAAPPPAGNVLFLDFDGAMVSSRAGDFWLGNNSIEIPAYGLSSFGWAGREQESIDYIMQFVTEDYAPFNISVMRPSRLAVSTARYTSAATIAGSVTVAALSVLRRTISAITTRAITALHSARSWAYTKTIPGAVFRISVNIWPT